jgi:hypothetical protein
VRAHDVREVRIDMEAVREHLQAYYVFYIVGALVVLPPLVYFRRRTFPAILYTIEFCLYASIMHVVVYVLAVSAAWFRENTAMHAVSDAAKINPGWETPILNFWEIKHYHPQWLYKFELAVLVVMLLGMWRYRPMVVRKTKKKAPPKKTAGYAKYSGNKTQFGGKK